MKRPRLQRPEQNDVTIRGIDANLARFERILDFAKLVRFGMNQVFVSLVRLGN